MSTERQDHDPGDAGRARWTQVRAILVALHVLAVVLLALPSPGAGIHRSAWKDPTVQDEFHLWAERLTAIGIAVDHSELEDRAWEVARTWVRWRAAIVAPFYPYREYVGIRQPWRMFVAPHRHPTALHVDIEEHGQWRAVYVEGIREHDWRGRQFDHDRFRAALFRYGWPRYRSTYDGLASWIADRAAVDFPTADRVRISMYKYRTPTPEEVREQREPRGRFQQEVVIVLEGRR